MIKSKGLLCSGNSCRTQMAEASLRDLAGDSLRGYRRRRSQSLGQRFTYAERTCPIFPGAMWRQQWDLENSAIALDHRAAVRRVVQLSENTNKSRQSDHGNQRDR
jgi:protein-tyrosine-phosphatase